MVKGQLFTISAPSGAGKTSLLRSVLGELEGIVCSVSHTTRDRRKGEEEGVDYHYVNREEFGDLINRGAFLEYAEVFGNFYGTSQAAVEAQLDAGLDVMLEIDWQGAAQVRRLLPDTVSVFVLPPSLEKLEERLRARGRDGDDAINYRMAKAVSEMSHYAESHYLIVNEDFGAALAQLKGIVLGQRARQVRQAERYGELISELLGG